MGGLILIGVGAFISFTPTLYLSQFVQASQINIDILSEMRGMGGSLFVFGSFALFRCIGIVIDGAPNNGILAALGVEMVFAVLGIILWLKANYLQSKDQHALM